MTRAETKRTLVVKERLHTRKSGHPTTGEVHSVSLDAGVKAAQAASQVAAEGVITSWPATRDKDRVLPRRKMQHLSSAFVKADRPPHLVFFNAMWVALCWH